MNADLIIPALAALAHEHRLEVFRLLVTQGPDGLAAGDIARALDIPNSSLSFHLAQLQQAGLLTQQRAGRSLIYSADFSAMSALIGFLTENCCGGAPCDLPAEIPTQIESCKGL